MKISELQKGYIFFNVFLFEGREKDSFKILLFDVGEKTNVFISCSC